MRRLLALGLIIVVFSVWFGLTTWGQPLEIWIRSVYYPPFNEWLKSKILEWSEQTGVEVNVSIISDYLLDEKLINAIETRVTPDIIFNAESGVTLALEAGLAVPLEDVVDRLGRDDFYPLALQAYALTDLETGQKFVYAIPMFFEFGYWYIRTDLLEAAGMEIPEEPTWEWLVEAAKAMNNPPEVYGLGIPISPSYDALNVFAFLLYHYGGGFITELAPGGADIFNTEPTWRLFEDLKQLYKDEIIPPDAVSWTDFDNNLSYMEGRIATTWNPGSIMGAMLKQNHPLIPYTKMIAIPPISLGGECVFVFKSTPEREAHCKDLICYVFSDKETYRVKSADEAGLYGVPIFKSQGAIISQKYEAGEFPFLGSDPMVPIARGEAFFGTNVPYPYGEATSVFEAAASSFQITAMMGPLFIKDADPKQVAQDISLWLNARLTAAAR